MKLDNFYVVRYKDNKETAHGVCYYEPGADVNSPEFKEEFGYPEDVILRKVPQEHWTVADIKNIMDAIFDDRCKPSPYYAPSDFEAVLDGLGLDKAGKQKDMLGILKCMEQHFGY